MKNLKTWQKLTDKEIEMLSSIPTINVIEEYKGVQISFKNKNDMENYLKEKANKFLNKYFNTNLDIPIIINDRLRSSYGDFRCDHNNKPLKITINGDYFNYKQDDVSSLLDTLYHECVHYVLLKYNVRNDDGDLVFDTILNRLGIATNFTGVATLNSLYNLYGCECRDLLYVLNGTKKPRESYPWVKCENCQGAICFVRQEVGTRPKVVNSFANDTLLKDLFDNKIQA